MSFECLRRVLFEKWRNEVKLSEKIVYILRLHFFKSLVASWIPSLSSVFPHCNVLFLIKRKKREGEKSSVWSIKKSKLSKNWRLTEISRLKFEKVKRNLIPPTQKSKMLKKISSTQILCNFNDWIFFWYRKLNILKTIKPNIS